MNYLKKVGLGSNFFKKAERTGANIFKKTGEFVNNLPSVASQVGSTVRNIANEVQKKTAQYAPVASSIAYSLGQPALGALIGSTAMKINNYANQANNAVNNAQNASRNVLEQ